MEIVKEMRRRFKKKTGVDISKDNRATVLLKLECEKAKKALSYEGTVSVRITVANIARGLDLDEELNQSSFDFLCSDLFENLTDPIDNALFRAGISKEAIDQIILVGGSCKIPAVQSAVKDFFDDRLEPKFPVSPDISIALGACILCDKKQRNEIKDLIEPVAHTEADVPPEDDGFIQLVETLPTSIGVRSGRTRFVPFLHSGQPLPQVSRELTFQPLNDFAPFARVTILQGEDTEIDPSQNTHTNLGEFEIRGFPPMERNKILIRVTMSVGVDGFLKVDAKCNADGTFIQNGITINAHEKLDSKEMDELIKMQHRLAKTKELKFKCEKLLNTMHELISKLKSKGKEYSSWQAMYNNLSKSIPSKLEDLQKFTNDLEFHINKLKELV